MSADAPPRHLYLCPSYELRRLPEERGPRAVGYEPPENCRIQMVCSLVQDENYIPPCLTMESHPRLLKHHGDAGTFLKTMHDDGLKIVQQYRAERPPQCPRCRGWIERLVTQLSGVLWTYNDLLPGQTPAQTLIFFKNWTQFVLSTALMYENNPYLKDGLKTQSQHFRKIATAEFADTDLQPAFSAISDVLKGLYQWLKAIANPSGWITKCGWKMKSRKNNERV